MTRIYILTIVCLCLYIFYHSRAFKTLRQKWNDLTFHTRKDKLTMFDVRQMLIKGEKDLAIRVYCELFKTSPEEASQAVEEIERSIQPKDFEL